MIEYDLVGNWYRITRSFTMQTDIIPDRRIETKFSSLSKGGKVVIHKGFCWDAKDNPKIMHGSCVHYAFVNWCNKGLINKDQRKQADQLFRRINRAKGASKIRRALRKYLKL